MKQKRVAELYRFLSVASMKRMTDDEKVAFIRLLRTMKPLCVELQSAVDDAIIKAREETDDQQKVVALVNKAVADIAERDCDVNIQTMSAEAFDRLSLSNDWSFAQIDELEAELVEKKNGE